MKKNFLIAILALISFNLSAQKAAPMKGYWYSPTSQEMFVITVDPADNLIFGRGMKYSSGNGSFKEMQIMTQTTKKAKDDSDVYFVKVYDPKKPKVAWEVTSAKKDGNDVLAVTVTGSRDVINYFYNLKNMKQ